MPLTSKGKEILSNMEKAYPSEKKAKEVFYASANKGTITGVHNDRGSKMSNDVESPKPESGPMSTKGPSGGKVEGLTEAATPSSSPKANDCGSEMSLDAIKSMGKRIGKY